MILPGIPRHWAVLLDARSVLDDPCLCEGNPPTYKYRKDQRQHCMWCDGLAHSEVTPG